MATSWTLTARLPPASRSGREATICHEVLSDMSGPSADGAQDLVILGEPAHLTLREDQLAIQRHFVHTAGAFHEAGLHLELLFDQGRQTGGPGKVVSLAAVFDLDPHHAVLLE
jgi:hypothetical protein